MSRKPAHLLRLARSANVLPWALGLAFLQALQTLLTGASSNISAGFYASLVDGSEARFLRVVLYACALYALVSLVAASTTALAEMAALCWRVKVCSGSQQHYCRSYGFLWLGQSHGAFCAPTDPNEASPASPGCGRRDSTHKELSGNNVDSPDQRLTADIDLAASAAATVIQAIAGVPLSLAVYGTMAASAFGSVWPLAAGAAYFLCGAAAQRVFVRAAAGLTFRQEALEGQLRSAHARLRSCADALAQASAAPYEAAYLDQLLSAVATNKRKLVYVRWGLGVLTKAIDFGGAILCYGCVAVAVLGGGWGPSQHPSTTDLITNVSTTTTSYTALEHSFDWSTRGSLFATSSPQQYQQQLQQPGSLSGMLASHAAPGAFVGAAGAALMKQSPGYSAAALGLLASTAALPGGLVHASPMPRPTPDQWPPLLHQKRGQHSDALHYILGGAGAAGPSGAVTQETTPGDVAARIAKASFLLLTFIYSLTSLLDLSGNVSTLVGAARRVSQLNQALEGKQTTPRQLVEQQHHHHHHQQQQQQQQQHGTVGTAGVASSGSPGCQGLPPVLGIRGLSIWAPALVPHEDAAVDGDADGDAATGQEPQRVQGVCCYESDGVVGRTGVRVWHGATDVWGWLKGACSGLRWTGVVSNNGWSPVHQDEQELEQQGQVSGAGGNAGTRQSEERGGVAGSEDESEEEGTEPLLASRQHEGRGGTTCEHGTSDEEQQVQGHPMDTGLENQQQQQHHHHHQQDQGRLEEADAQPGGSQPPTSRLLLSDFDLDLFPGDRLLLVGPDGCGKTSLVRSLLGLWRLCKGHIEVAPCYPVGTLSVEPKPSLPGTPDHIALNIAHPHQTPHCSQAHMRSRSGEHEPVHSSSGANATATDAHGNRASSILVLSQQAVCAPGPTTLKQQLLYPSLQSLHQHEQQHKHAVLSQLEQQQQQQWLNLLDHVQPKCPCLRELGAHILAAGQCCEVTDDAYMVAALCAVGLGSLVGLSGGAAPTSAQGVQSQSPADTASVAGASGWARAVGAAGARCAASTQDVQPPSAQNEAAAAAAAAAQDAAHTPDIAAAQGGLSEQAVCASSMWQHAMEALRELHQEWSAVLSPGQLQRLAAARALCTRPLPSLLVLDEALSSVPEQEEAALHRLLISVLCLRSYEQHTWQSMPVQPVLSVQQQQQTSSLHGASHAMGMGTDIHSSTPALLSQVHEHPQCLQPQVWGEGVRALPPRAAVITISHRPSSLMPLHSLRLHMHGDARWELQQSATSS